MIHLLYQPNLQGYSYSLFYDVKGHNKQIFKNQSVVYYMKSKLIM